MQSSEARAFAYILKIVIFSCSFHPVLNETYQKPAETILDCSLCNSAVLLCGLYVGSRRVVSD